MKAAPSTDTPLDDGFEQNYKGIHSLIFFVTFRFFRYWDEEIEKQQHVTFSQKNSGEGGPQRTAEIEQHQFIFEILGETRNVDLSHFKSFLPYARSRVFKKACGQPFN